MTKPELKAEQCLKEVMALHRDPGSSEYNECEKDGQECYWCANAKKAIEELHDMTDIIRDLVAQGCNTSDGEVDSCAISTYADAMRWLASIGRLEITRQYSHRGLIGKWPTKKSANEEIREAMEE